MFPSFETLLCTLSKGSFHVGAKEMKWNVVSILQSLDIVFSVQLITEMLKCLRYYFKVCTSLIPFSANKERKDASIWRWFLILPTMVNRSYLNFTCLESEAVLVLLRKIFMKDFPGKKLPSQINLIGTAQELLLKN